MSDTEPKPSPEAMARAYDLYFEVCRADDEQDIPLDEFERPDLMTIARALDAFRAEGVERERLRMLTYRDVLKRKGNNV